MNFNNKKQKQQQEHDQEQEEQDDHEQEQEHPRAKISSLLVCKDAIKRLNTILLDLCKDVWMFLDGSWGGRLKMPTQTLLDGCH